MFDLSKDSHGNTGIVVFVDQLSKMALLETVPGLIDRHVIALMSIDRVFRQNGSLVAIVAY